jgi:hypothetical protein
MPVTHCAICHRLLTDAASVRIGIGPECRSKLVKRGWKFPKPQWRVRNGHVELVGMVGKLERPKEENAEAEK